MTRWLIGFFLGALAVVAIAYSVGGCLEREQNVTNNNDLPHTNPTATPRPTRTQEPERTATPAPKWEATQRALDEQAAALKAEQEAQRQAIEAQRLEATTKADKENLEQLRRMNDAAYALALDKLEAQQSANAADAALQATLSNGILAKQQALDASEIRAAQKLDDWTVTLQMIWIAAWRGLVLIAVMLFIVLLFINGARRNEYDAEILAMGKRFENQLRDMEHQYIQEAQERTTRINIISQFIYDACRYGDADYHQVPPNTKMDGWNADRWQRAVNLLKEDGVIYTSNQGTFTKDGVGTLGELRDEIERGEYPSPTTPARVPDDGGTQGMQEKKNARL